MKSRLLATSIALALCSVSLPVSFAQQNDIVVAQADDAVAIENFNKLIGDARPASQLNDVELKDRLNLIRKLQGNKSLSKPQLQRVRKIAQDTRQESIKRRQAKVAEDKKQAATQPEVSADGSTAAAGGTNQTAQADDGAALQAEAQKFLAETANVKSLDPAGLRGKANQARKLVQNPAMPRSMLPKLRERQKELRTAIQAAAAAEKPATSDQQQTGDGQPAKPAEDMTQKAEKFLAETANAKAMSEADLRTQMKVGRTLIQSPGTPKSLLPKVRDRQRDLRTAFQALGTAKPGDTQTGEQKPADKPAAPNEQEKQEAQKILDDTRPATSLSQPELRDRLRAAREVLSGGTLPPNTAKQLRLKLAKDRIEFRRRVALETGKPRPGTNDPNNGKNEPLQADDFYLKDERRAVTLTTRELERRVLVRRIAVVDTRYPAARRAVWRDIIESDRAELRRRALDDRRRRLADWRGRRDRGELNISINIDISPEDDGYGRPRPIYLAEAEDDDIDRYLAAAPIERPARRYTIDEVRAQPEVRQTMPAIEIDTIKFGFNEDFVREEALDDLDRVGESMEKLLTAHPREVFLIEGHTDAVGSDSYNIDLSRRRAEAVKQALTTYYNIDPRNLETAGYGERFLRINTTEAEEENRRVTMRRATPLVGELE